MNPSVLSDALSRIQRMETVFDTLLKAAAANPEAIRTEKHLMMLLEELTRYYESGQWLQDYTLDEKGLLPPQLKRGVLAQDAVFDFLQQLSSTSSAPKCQEELTYEKII